MKSLALPFFFVGTLGLASPPASTDDSALPGEGFVPTHYETLWTKSPFAVATADAASTESADYSLVGVVQFDGISYANLIDKGSQEHFLLASDKPVRGLTLVSVNKGHDPSDMTVVIQRNGESISLKLEQGPTVGAMAQNVPQPNPYQAMPPPNGYSGYPGQQPGMPGMMPMHRRRFPPIRIPPQPFTQQPVPQNQNPP